MANQTRLGVYVWWFHVARRHCKAARDRAVCVMMNTRHSHLEATLVAPGGSARRRRGPGRGRSAAVPELRAVPAIKLLGLSTASRACELFL